MAITTRNYRDVSLAPIGVKRMGQVATGCWNNDNSANAGVRSINSRNSHIARDKLVSFQIVLQNFIAAEATAGSAGSITASIEYPAGTFTQVLFGGSTSAATGGTAALITSDAIALAIPKGAQFWTRIWCLFPSNAPYFTGNTPGNFAQELFEFSSTALTDKTMGGTIANQTQAAFKPAAIIAQTSVPSVAIIGDSRFSLQVGADSGDTLGHFNPAARSIGPTTAFLSVAQTGTALQAYIGTHTLRDILVNYCSQFVCNFGINDIVLNSRTAAQVLADLNTLFALYPTMMGWQATYEPVSSSTDSWVTTANQTTSAFNSIRVTANNNIRSGLVTRAVGILELADDVESARDSGLWAAFATALTSDGTHRTRRGAMACLSPPRINPALFVK